MSDSEESDVIIFDPETKPYGFNPIIEVPPRDDDDKTEPYEFDPIIEVPLRDDDDEYLTESSASDDLQDAIQLDDDHDTGINPEEFCGCGNCIRMKNLHECICCKSEILPLIQLKIGSEPELRCFNEDGSGGREVIKLKGKCVTEYPTFKNIIKDPELIKMHLIRMSHQSSKCFPHEPVQDSKFRYGAYRMVTLWIHGVLGRENRKVLPSCIVNKIRTLYPDCDVNYTGFKEFAE